jgi:hypothetical protein
MHHRNHNHAALFNTEWQMNEGTRLYTQFSFNESSSALGDLLLSTNGLPGVPAGYDYAAISDLGGYSDLRVRRVLQVVGFEKRIAERLVFNNELWWHDYDDGEPYLFNTNGRNIGLRVSMHWLF